MGTGVDVEALNDALPTVGFAKLCVMSNGDDPANGETYIVQKYEIILGRQSKSSQVDVVLGVFQLEVLGKNGLLHNGKVHMVGSDPVPLSSQDIVEIGGSKFYFLLPVTEK